LKDSSTSHLGKERRKIGYYRVQDSVVPICWAVIQTDSKDPLSERVTHLPLKWATATRAEEARGTERRIHVERNKPPKGGFLHHS
jgi:hypothetical protein